MAIKNSANERYTLERSPFAQKPTQKDIAKLVGETKSDLNTLAKPNYKEPFIVRRPIDQPKRDGTVKRRDLVYPTGRLRAVHERLKFHFSKIKQPSYLMSPRKGRAQRDNAIAHLDAHQYLTLDLKQFYPSTSRTMIRNALMNLFAMSADVSGLIAHLATVDDRACFGSPLTPVLATFVHREMFNEIADLCDANGFAYSVWVDDLTISGPEISGSFLVEIRGIISRYRLRSHKIEFRTGNRPVFITGVGVVGANLIVPRYMEEKSKELWADYKAAVTHDAKDAASIRLLSHLGSLRSIIGETTKRGQKLANEIHSVRQKREKAHRQYMQMIERERLATSAAPTLVIAESPF